MPTFKLAILMHCTVSLIVSLLYLLKVHVYGSNHILVYACIFADQYPVLLSSGIIELCFNKINCQQAVLRWLFYLSKFCGTKKYGSLILVSCKTKTQADKDCFSNIKYRCWWSTAYCKGFHSYGWVASVENLWYSHW